MPEGYELVLIRGRLAWAAPGGAIYVAVETGRYDFSLYLMHVGACPLRRARFRNAWIQTGRHPVMNYARLRFRTLADLDRAVLSRTIRSTSPDQLLTDTNARLGYSPHSTARKTRIAPHEKAHPKQ